MPKRYGKSRYPIYGFPEDSAIQSWCTKLQFELLRNPDKFSDWDVKFINNCADYLRKNRELTEEQVYKLETLYAHKTV